MYRLRASVPRIIRGFYAIAIDAHNIRIKHSGLLSQDHQKGLFSLFNPGHLNSLQDFLPTVLGIIHKAFKC